MKKVLLFFMNLILVCDYIKAMESPVQHVSRDYKRCFSIYGIKEFGDLPCFNEKLKTLSEKIDSLNTAYNNLLKVYPPLARIRECEKLAFKDAWARITETERQKLAPSFVHVIEKAEEMKTFYDSVRGTPDTAGIYEDFIIYGYDKIRRSVMYVMECGDIDLCIRALGLVNWFILGGTVHPHAKLAAAALKEKIESSQDRLS